MFLMLFWQENIGIVILGFELLAILYLQKIFPAKVIGMQEE